MQVVQAAVPITELGESSPGDEARLGQSRHKGILVTGQSLVREVA